MKRLLTVLPLVALVLSCNSTTPRNLFIQVDVTEASAPPGFTPTATIQGGQEVLIVLGDMHGSLCDSRLTPSTVLSGSIFRLTLTRSFVPPTVACDTVGRKIDYTVTFFSVEPGSYSVEVTLDDQVLNERSTTTLGPVVVISL